MGKKEKIDYYFKAKDNIDYNIEFTMKTKHKLFTNMFQAAVRKARRKAGKKGKGSLKNIQKSIELVEKFEVDPRFYFVLHTAINRRIKQVEKNLRKNKIELLNSKVTSSYFERPKDSDSWNIKINVGGQYVDKRFR